MATVKSSNAGAIFLQSKMWLVTAFCLLLAVGLAWNSVPNEGPKLSIRFPEGHGLKQGDAVRYRGIDVGTVTTVRLNQQLSGVIVDVTLIPGAEGLNRQGSRFWIVRPRLSLTEVSGLETAVGAKYISVSPGAPTDSLQNQFEGLPSAPADELRAGGLELVLQGDNLHGVGTGAPVRWRGMEVGQVLSAGLSPDARHVHISIRINGAYRRLVRSTSRFWVTSGFDVDVGLSGVKLTAESLSTIAMGGISFITPTADDATTEILSGHVFPLHDKLNDEWMSSADGALLMNFSMPQTVVVSGQRRQSFLGISRMKNFQQSGILISDGNAIQLLTAQMPTSESDADRLAEFQIRGVGAEPVPIKNAAMADCVTTTAGTIRIPLTSGTVSGQTFSISPQLPAVPEDVIIVRSGSQDGRAVPVVQPIDKGVLSADDGIWTIVDSERDFTEWHGAPVVTAETGQIIGLLIVGTNGPIIAGAAN